MRLKLEVKNLNNSLVFYRNLFGVHPYHMNADEVKFKNDQWDLTLRESYDPKSIKVHRLKTESIQQTQEVFARMHRYIRNFSREDCKVLQEQFGVVDFDGHKWIVGSIEESTNIEFKECYLLPI